MNWDEQQEKLDELCEKIDNWTDLYNCYAKQSETEIWANRKDIFESFININEKFCSEDKIIKMMQIAESKDNEKERDIDIKVLSLIRKIDKMSMSATSYRSILIYSSMKTICLCALFSTENENIQKYITTAMSLRKLID